MAASSSSAGSRPSKFELDSDYTAKSIVVFAARGSNLPEDMMTALEGVGGKKNHFRYKRDDGVETRAPGVVFSKQKLAAVTQLLAQLDAGKAPAPAARPSAPPPRQDRSAAWGPTPTGGTALPSMADFMRLMGRVDALEQEVGLLRSRLGVGQAPAPMATKMSQRVDNEAAEVDDDGEDADAGSDNEMVEAPPREANRRIWGPSDRVKAKTDQ